VRRGSRYLNVLSGTATPYRWFDSRTVVRWFWESSATQLASLSPPGALASLMKISVITPYSGRFGYLTWTL
jgi:hypothetical protein